MVGKLAHLDPGQKARVTGFVHTDPQLRRHMMVMGLTLGAEVQFIRTAPLGDPMEFKVRGFSLGLRYSEAALIEVETPS